MKKKKRSTYFNIIGAGVVEAEKKMADVNNNII